jgi:hypothetical protein
LYSAFLSSEFDFVRGSIVLNFLAGRKLVLPRGLLGWLGEAMPAAEGGQGLVGEHGPAGHEFFMDPHKIPLAAGQQLQDLLPIGFGLLRTLERRHLGGVGTKHLAHAQTRDAQQARDLAFLHSLSMQFQNRASLTLTQHVLVPLLVVLLAGFLLPDDGVLAGRDPAGGVLVRSAHHPSARIRQDFCSRVGWPV